MICRKPLLLSRFIPGLKAGEFVVNILIYLRNNIKTIKKSLNVYHITEKL